MHVGGTERQLVTLAKGLDKRKFDVQIALLYAEGDLLNELASIENIKIFNLLKKGRWDLIHFFRRLIAFIRQNSFDVVYSFLPDVNLIAVLASKASRCGLRLIWGIRASNMDLPRYGWLPVVSYRVQRLLAGFPDAVISNSLAGLQPIVRSNPFVKKAIVIPNGIDVRRFRPSSAAWEDIRRHLNVSDHEKLIGIVARIDPMKDHETFISSIRILESKAKNLRYICVGSGPRDSQARLVRMAIDKNIDKKIIWFGTCLDMPSMYNAMDVLCSASSHGEGFSNVIAEAMACGIPCVVTDVGDSRMIVGDTGVVVAPGEPEALAAGILEILNRKTQSAGLLGKQARRRIVEKFSVDHLVATTSAVIEELCGILIRQ
jgi:glycosyltransferase involved in cell wall biosynthesis